MSWISGLADKAENILNKIDQNAATALQLPETQENPFLKTLSNSTQSLKSTLSPTKLKGSAGSVKSDSVGLIIGGMTDSVNSAEHLEWNTNVTDVTTSRKNSISSSKAEAIAIDMDAVESVKSVEQNNSESSVAKKAPIHTSKSSFPMDSQELMAFKIALNEVTNERDELRLRLSALNRDIENAGLKQRAQELEMLVQRLNEERDQAQQELLEAQTASGAYVHSLSELETNLAKLQQEYLDVAQKLQMQMKVTEQQRQELQEYRVKAQRALQIKDNLIAELKVNGGVTAAGSSDSDGRLLQIEFDAVKQEHQQALEENRNLVLQLDEIRQDSHAFSKQHAEQMAVLRTNEETLRKELRLERERALAIESEQRMLTQELVKLRQQLSNQMAAAATRLQEKEQQLQRLRDEKMDANKTTGAEVSTGNHDNRMQTLTQALVNKQNAVENITAERNALRIQLEKVQDQLQRSMYNNESLVNNSNSAPRNALLSNSTDDVKAQFPLLMRENPFDNRVARRVKRVYSSLDSAGIRLGRYLRRYPLMRIFVLMYVALLHIWVVFVLLSSTPNAPN